MTNQEVSTELEHSRIYWFFYHLRQRIVGGTKAWIKRHPIWTALIILFLLYNLFVGRAAIQPGVLFLRKYSLLILLVLLVFFLYRRMIKKRHWKKTILPTVLLLAFIAASVLWGGGVHDYLSHYFHYSNLQKVEIAQLPISGNERIQPLNSIRTLINQEALSETEDATRPHFSRGTDGRYYFTSCVGPSKAYRIQQLTKNMYEVLNVPAYLPSPVFSKKYRADVNFEVGEQLLFSKNTLTAVTKRFGLLDYITTEAADPIYLQNDTGRWVQVVPIIRWTGLVFPRPVFGGVYIIDQETDADNYFSRTLLGKGEYVSEEEIMATAYLRGQNLQPKEVLDYTARSFKFANGFLAPMPGYHEGDIRIPALPEDQNPMPFETYLEIEGQGKIYNYFGLEPYEENKKGLSLSLFLAGDNDRTVYYMNHRNEKYIGSSAIASKIIESKKNYDWSVNYPAESRMFVREIDGKRRFFWLSTIVSKAGDGAGEYIGGSVPELCLTSAVYGKVIWLDKDSLFDSNAWTREASRQMQVYWSEE